LHCLLHKNPFLRALIIHLNNVLKHPGLFVLCDIDCDNYYSAIFFLLLKIIIYYQADEREYNDLTGRVL